MIRSVAFAMLLGIATPGVAQVVPTPGRGDPRLQTVAYDPDQVVQLQVASGYALMVSFAPGERIETIAIGDAAAWQATANKRGDYLFVKNLSASSTTNLNVVTDARVYAFELQPGGYAAVQPFALRFTYGATDPGIARVVLVPEAYRYRLGGAKALRPGTIESRDGNLVLGWPEGVTLPAVFRIDEDGQESLVNGEPQNGGLIVEGMPAKLVFRVDRLTATATRVPIKRKSR
jgi:type IV secretion system protein VirB9